MIEFAMYFGIGLLLGALIGLVLVPLVHGRAVRLTTRQLRAELPESIFEVQAEKDLLRAEFAMSTRRLEVTIEELMNKTARQMVELARKDEIIDKLKFERTSQQIEIITLKGQVGSLSEPPIAADGQAELTVVPTHSTTELTQLLLSLGANHN